jgi:hypothetical protein
MAVADYRVNNLRVAMRHFEVPKRAAELKYWYRAAERAMPQLPKFEPRFLVAADITVETIIMDWVTDGFHHRLLIARKRRLL